MNLKLFELNTRYGAPGRIVFREGLGGYPEVVLSNKFGVAEVALLGGNTLSYRPTGHPPVLFRSAFRDYERGREVHGGCPICWPWFGKSGEPGTKSHGFARFCVFEVRGSSYSEEMTEVTLGLKSSEETKAIWNYDFDLEFKVSVSMKLNLSLKTANTGDKEFLLTEGFHPYFLVKDRNLCEVKGTDKLAFIDARDMGNGEMAGDFKLTGEADHVFTLKEEPKHEFALIDNGIRRAIGLASTGNKKLVVWNPGPAAKLYDLAGDDWRKFVCVEPATLWRDAGWILAPGEKHSLEFAIQSTLAQ